MIIFNLNDEMFVIHISALKTKTLINCLKKIIFLIKYSDYTNTFIYKFLEKFLEYNDSNYIMRLYKKKQLFYGIVYSLKSIKLEILKVYIKTNLIYGFIWPSKSFICILILFN